MAIRPAKVRVLRPREGRDAWGRPPSGPGALEEVGTAPALWYTPLVADANADAEAPMAGDEARMGFHFPPEWAGRLAGCTVGLPDGTLWDVVGDPRGHMAANCPGPYSVNFTATRHTGAVPR